MDEVMALTNRWSQPLARQTWSHEVFESRSFVRLYHAISQLSIRFTERNRAFNVAT